MRHVWGPEQALSCCLLRGLPSLPAALVPFHRSQNLRDSSLPQLASEKVGSIGPQPETALLAPELSVEAAGALARVTSFQLAVCSSRKRTAPRENAERRTCGPARSGSAGPVCGGSQASSPAHWSRGKRLSHRSWPSLCLCIIAHAPAAVIPHPKFSILNSLFTIAALTPPILPP